MKPTIQKPSATDGMSRQRLEQILNQRHPLYRLSETIDWTQAEERFGGFYVEEGRPGYLKNVMSSCKTPSE